LRRFDVTLTKAPLLLCIGDIDMDLIVRVKSPPGRDQKVDATRVTQSGGGMAANVAVGARRLGTLSRIVGSVGDDTLGREALGVLATERVDHRFVAVKPGETTFFCVIMVDDAGEKSLIKVLSPVYLPRPDDLVPDAFAGVSHVHLTFTSPELAARAIAMARVAGATLSLDLEAADLPKAGAFLPDLLRAVDLLFLSENSRHEAEQIIGPLENAGPRMVLTTLGNRGAMLEHSGGRSKVPGHRVKVVDTSGAGDAFAAAFLHSWLGGHTLETALVFANAAAALSTRAYGAQGGLADGDEVDAFLSHSSKEQSDA
jgi:sugar/nucleoside kinase (ribokinase family)